MKISFLSGCVLILWTVSFSQSAYVRCIQECILAGGDSASCAYEACNPADTIKDVVVGQGNPLYLPSYELKGPAPVIDGSLLSRDGDPSSSDAMDEWKEACSRTLMLDDSTLVQLFLVNSPDTLYVGMTYQDIDNSNGCGTRLLFDQGNNVPPSQYHGSTDMHLSAPNGIANEQGCAIYKAGGGVSLHDLCWNGTIWIDDADGQINFKGANYFYNTSSKIHHYEYAIPLHNGKAFDAANSDLNVHYNDAIGFYLEVVKMGANAGTYHWIETNGNALRADAFPLWAKIQLSVPRDYFTFYTGRGPNPPPTIDGTIQEAAWNGAYQRELLLSNYHYGTVRSKIWCLEDSAQNSIYIGVRIYDKTHNPQDNCRIYFEEDGTNTTNPTRNYILDNNAENAQAVTNGNVSSDLYWNLSSGVWASDPVANANQTSKAGQTASYADYEFKVMRSGGANNIDIPRGGLLGFLVRYHDADRADQDRSNFLWEFTTNNDAQLLDYQSHPYVYITTGWANLQLGGPYIQVVSPTTIENVSGIVPVEVSSGKDSLKSVVCFLSTDTLTRTTLVYQGNGTWKGSITIPGGSTGVNPMLVVRAVATNDVAYERIVNKVDTVGVISSLPSISPEALKASLVGQSGKGINFLVNLSKPGSFDLGVYAVDGSRVWAYHSGNAAAGLHRISWGAGSISVCNGTYFMKLCSGNQKFSGKFTALR
jgi:hypothetical protein